jgi:hypothetical protein
MKISYQRSRQQSTTRRAASQIQIKKSKACRRG